MLGKKSWFCSLHRGLAYKNNNKKEDVLEKRHVTLSDHTLTLLGSKHNSFTNFAHF